VHAIEQCLVSSGFRPQGGSHSPAKFEALACVETMPFFSGHFGKTETTCLYPPTQMFSHPCPARIGNFFIESTDARSVHIGNRPTCIYLTKHVFKRV
jgi:hypothetical protein